MPAVTYLSDWEVKSGRTVPDKEVNEVLQELREVSGEGWIILIKTIKNWPKHKWFGRRKQPTVWDEYTLYADCHGEWQIMNMKTPNGGSVFTLHPNSKCDVVNYMLGYISGMQRAIK